MDLITSSNLIFRNDSKKVTKIIHKQGRKINIFSRTLSGFGRSFTNISKSLPYFLEYCVVINYKKSVYG